MFATRLYAIVLLLGILTILGEETVPRGEAGKLSRPDLVKRPFMLGPMADLAPDLVHPTLKVTIGELWRRFDQAAHPMTRVPAA